LLLWLLLLLSSLLLLLLLPSSLRLPWSLRHGRRRRTSVLLRTQRTLRTPSCTSMLARRRRRRRGRCPGRCPAARLFSSVPLKRVPPVPPVLGARLRRRTSVLLRTPSCTSMLPRRRRLGRCPGRCPAALLFSSVPLKRVPPVLGLF
jgi:hypothetical protein